METSLVTAEPKEPRKNKPGAGRPKLILCEEDITSLAQIGCTNVEIAHIIGCSDDTIVNNYSEALKQGRSIMQSSIRRHQLRLLKDCDNATMGIWLGKQYLGQKDKVTVDNNHIVTVLTKQDTDIC